MGVNVSFTGENAKVDFSETHDFTIKVKNFYTEYRNNRFYERYEKEYTYNGKGNFIQLGPDGSPRLYSIDKSVVINKHQKVVTYNEDGSVKSSNESDTTHPWQSSALSFNQINNGGDTDFSSLLGISSITYNNWKTDHNIRDIFTSDFYDSIIGGGNYLAYATGTPILNRENLDLIEIDFSIECNLPIFFSYACETMYGFPSLGYESVGVDKNVQWSLFTKAGIPDCIDGGTWQGQRHYALAYMIYDIEKYGEGTKPKDAFWEGVHTFFDYDGTKKASLIIQHRLDLEEFQHFENETEVYKLPGYAVNIAVNIQTVNPVSGDSVNVYNLHKLDYIKDGFIGSPDVDENGLSKKYIYSYGDLVKACNNTVLNLPMKLTVEVLQFDDQKDSPPYVVYENPINPTPDIKEEQHLGIPGTIAYPYVNSLEWRKYPNEDDGENSGGDGKNDDKGDKSGGTGSGQGIHNVLTTTYVSNATRLQALGDFLWSSSFLDNILLVNNNPIENVISVKMFPFTLPTGADSTIVLGNVNTEVPTNKLPDNYNYYHVYGSISVPSYYNNFMDYAPYTRILLYLPFYGTLELDNSLVIDRTLKIAYIVDVVTGACTIDIYANDSLITVVSCQVGIDIPITSSNRAQVESAILTNTLTSAVSGAKVGGGVGAVIGGVGGALMSAGHCKYNTQTSGTPSSATELYNVSVPMLIIDRPKYREISGFAHNKGKMCMLTKKLNDVSGFSIFDENIDLSGVACTDTEQEIIRNLLKTGIYL